MGGANGSRQTSLANSGTFTRRCRCKCGCRAQATTKVASGQKKIPVCGSCCNNGRYGGHG